MTKERSILLFLMNFRFNPCLNSPRTFDAVIPPYETRIILYMITLYKINEMIINNLQNVADNFAFTSILYLVPSGSTELIKIDPSILFRSILVVNSTNLGSVPHLRLMDSFPLDTSWLQFCSKRIYNTRIYISFVTFHVYLNFMSNNQSLFNMLYYRIPYR